MRDIANLLFLFIFFNVLVIKRVVVSGRGRAAAQGGPEDPGREGPDPGAHDRDSR